MNLETTLAIPSIRDQVSPEEWKARVELAACYRLFDIYGLSDKAANHISVRVPGEESFLINPFGMHYDEITASSLLKVNIDGKVLYTPDFGALNYGVNRAGYVIHSAIHEGRPDVGCVAHTHTVAGMAISALKCGILPLTQTAMRFVGARYHDFEGIVLDEREKDTLLRDLGDGAYMVLRNHGLLVATATVPEAFNAMHRFEQVCQAQIATLSCNSEVVPVPQQVVEETYKNYLPRTRRPMGLVEWPGMLRKLHRIDPSFSI